MNTKMPSRAGEVGILNVGDGDTKLSFDPKNPAERIRAGRIVKDMIRRGYALLVETTPGSGQYVRALDFNEEVCEYVIADFDPVTAAETDAQEEEHAHQQNETRPGTPAPAGSAIPARRRGRPPGKRSIPADSTRSVVVAPSAGG